LGAAIAISNTLCGKKNGMLNWVVWSLGPGIFQIQLVALAEVFLLVSAFSSIKMSSYSFDLLLSNTLKGRLVSIRRF